jgi:crotonobetainyl-CoA:carnitine CoA-transferase CaiB-like acyl-CoA transferase
MVLVDAAGGVYAANAVATALFHRTRTGRGRRVEMSLIGIAAALQSISIIDDHMHRGVVRPPVTVPSGTFRTADGLINLTAVRDPMFFALGRVIGHPEWESEPAYQTSALRLARAAEINDAVQRALLDDVTERWVARFREADVLCAPVLDYEAFRAHPQVQHEGVFSMLDQPAAGLVPIPALPGLAPEPPLHAAPFKGEHTAQILRSLGLDEAEIAKLESDGVIERGAADGRRAPTR